MASSNPFRRKSFQAEGRFPPIEAIDTAAARASHAPPPTSFRHDDDDDDASRDPEPASPPPAKTGTAPGGKPKVVKKVRVQSPPPLSPDSPEWPNNAAPSPSAMLEDPFNNGFLGDPTSNGGDWPATGMPPQTIPQQSSDAPAPGPAGPPGNPFNRTLHDLEGGSTGKELERELKEERKKEGAALKAANRGSLNVDSFRKLLLTGNAGNGSAAPPDPTAKTASLDSTHDEHATGEDGGYPSDSSTAPQSGQRKKAPPPPPSSRHGKSIRADAESAEAAPAPHTPKGPAAERPRVSWDGDDDGASHLRDAEAAAGLHGEADTDPVTGAKRSAPAPPPPRGRGRSGSKGQTPDPAQKASNEESGSSSSEAVPTRAGNRQSMHAPLPPPPRRPTVGQSTRSNLSSPAPATPNTEKRGLQDPSSPLTPPEAPTPAPSEAVAPSQDPEGRAPPKGPAPPPPPPARHGSTRHVPTTGSVEAAGWSGSGETGKPRDGTRPPPPPARRRGTSKGSADGPLRMTGSDDIPRQPASPGQGDAILADLDALQREVDALRGRLD